jgi:CubicO group peptidase (beta-lactamase class C family)
MTPRRTFIKQASFATAGILAARGPVSAAMNNIDGKAFDRLREDIRSAKDILRIPGLLAAIVEDGKITFVQEEGLANLEKNIPMRRDHIFPVASLTKTFASVILAQYEQEGKISTEDYILDYPFLSVGYSPERLPNPNVKIKHVLSHTSESLPGTNYVYNGSRYNFLYGVFEKVSGNTRHYDAFAQEVSRRIILPLSLKNTYPGYPAAPNNPSASKMVATYLLDPKSKTFSVADKNESTWTTLFPATNLFTTLDDLALYTYALDHNLLISAESYQKITSPFVSSPGRINPYGLGWGTQKVRGLDVHWHYGYGDSFAALLVRVPVQKMTFILFSNAVQPSEAFLLGYGNLLNSPFALSFLKNIAEKDQHQPAAFNYQELIADKNGTQKEDTFYDEVFSQALMRYYAEQTFGGHKEEAAVLLRYLATHDPGRFKKPDISLLWLIARLNDPKLSAEMEAFVAAYEDSGYFHPEIHEQIAQYYEKTANAEKSLKWVHLLADGKGFEEQQATRRACTTLGKYYIRHGEKEKGRSYLWREALYNRYTDSGTYDADGQLSLMKLP